MSENFCAGVFKNVRKWLGSITKIIFYVSEIGTQKVQKSRKMSENFLDLKLPRGFSWHSHFDELFRAFRKFPIWKILSILTYCPNSNFSNKDIIVILKFCSKSIFPIGILDFCWNKEISIEIKMTMASLIEKWQNPKLQYYSY